jgi:hypothetical protein
MLSNIKVHNFFYSQSIFRMGKEIMVNEQNLQLTTGREVGKIM